MHKILGLILAVVLEPFYLALPPLTQATSSLGAVELGATFMCMVAMQAKRTNTIPKPFSEPSSV